MLSAIKASLIEAIGMSDDRSNDVIDKITARWKQIELFLSNHDCIVNADVRTICQVSAATANRILKNLVDAGKLVKYRKGRIWAYRPAK